MDPLENKSIKGWLATVNRLWLGDRQNRGPCMVRIQNHSPGRTKIFNAFPCRATWIASGSSVTPISCDINPEIRITRRHCRERQYPNTQRISFSHDLPQLLRHQSRPPQPVATRVYLLPIDLSLDSGQSCEVHSFDT